MFMELILSKWLDVLYLVRPVIYQLVENCVAFLSFNAHFGCTRCWKEFSGEVGNQDFSGFDREKWKSRAEKEHREIAASLASSNAKAERARIESATGYKYTALLDLPYFNPILECLFWTPCTTYS